MFLRIGIAAVCVIIAALIALVLNRRRPTGPPVRDAARIPAQVERRDFVRPGAPFLVIAFSSAACEGCGPMVEKVRVLESREVATAEIEYTADKALHEKYEIDAVPLVLVTDAEGVVRRSFLGTASATDLWAAVAELRAPGSTPEPDLGHHDH